MRRSVRASHSQAMYSPLRPPASLLGQLCAHETRVSSNSLDLHAAACGRVGRTDGLPCKLLLVGKLENMLCAGESEACHSPEGTVASCHEHGTRPRLHQVPGEILGQAQTLSLEGPLVCRQWCPGSSMQLQGCASWWVCALIQARVALPECGGPDQCAYTKRLSCRSFSSSQATN